MSVKEKILEWSQILKVEDENYLRSKRETDPNYQLEEIRTRGMGLEPPIDLPIWGKDKTIPASKMVADWMNYANGWNEFALGRRALSLQEMRKPEVGLDFYIEANGNEDGKRHMRFLLEYDIPVSLQNLHHDPDFLSLSDPTIVLFSLPLLSSITGAEFLVFSRDLPDREPMVFLNEYAAKNIEDMLDWLISG